MRKANIILGLGVWLSVLPYLGFPYFIKNLLISFSALFIAYLSFMLYKAEKKSESGEGESFDNFSENKNFVLTKDPTQNQEEIILEENTSK